MTTTAPARPTRPSALTRNLIFIGLLALLVVVFATIDLKLERLADLPGQLANIGAKMFLEPDLPYFPDALELMVQSIQIAWIGTVMGAILSLPLGFLGAKNVTGGLMANGVRQLLNAIRAFPEIVLAIVFVAMIGLGPFAGTLAIGIHSIGTLGKLTAEVIEGIDPGPVEAARASGGNQVQTLRWGVFPQVAPEIVAFWLYRFEINVRASAILGIVGAGGIGEALSQALVYRRYERAGMLIIVVILATILIDLGSGWLRRRIIEGGSGRSGSTRMQPELIEVDPPDRARALP
jgi:phosphonate transport system permease protein